MLVTKFSQYRLKYVETVVKMNVADET